MVSEVASASTRVIDRTRKLQDYRLGGAGFYLLVDLPALAPVEHPTLTLYPLAEPGEAPVVATEELRFELAGATATLDPAPLTGPGWQAQAR